MPSTKEEIKMYQGGNQDGDAHVIYWVVESRWKANSDGVTREDLEGRNADVDVEELGEQHSGQKNQQPRSPQVCLAAGRERRLGWLELGETMT